MREIVLDTETTGLSPDDGHRIVEIGAVELHNHLPTGRTYHQYINPDRDMPPEALAVHGLTEAFLSDKPRFHEIGDAFLAFIGDARLVIHNASFDMRFLNAELGWMGRARLRDEQALDTLAMARERFPGAPSSLDALCRRFGIDNSARTLHGALLDSEILAEVYLELIGGRQPDFALNITRGAAAGPRQTSTGSRKRIRPRPLAPRLSDREKAAHRAFIGDLGGPHFWPDDPAG